MIQSQQDPHGVAFRLYGGKLYARFACAHPGCPEFAWARPECVEVPCRDRHGRMAAPSDILAGAPAAHLPMLNADGDDTFFVAEGKLIARFSCNLCNGDPVFASPGTPAYCRNRCRFLSIPPLSLAVEKLNQLKPLYPEEGDV